MNTYPTHQYSTRYSSLTTAGDCKGGNVQASQNALTKTLASATSYSGKMSSFKSKIDALYNAEKDGYDALKNS